jgi:FKBP-type peptidyl-prolyl cis-trans isomerase SlyD
MVDLDAVSLHDGAVKVARDSVVTFDYELRDDQGQLIDRGSGPGAMAYIHGHDMLVPGLEKELEGHAAGDHLLVRVPPAEGYGEERDQEEIRVARADLPSELEIEPGAELEGTDEEGQSDTFWVVAVEGDEVVLTRTHPLAGVTLCFDVTIRGVREATAEELEHGHAHEGPLGHHHD